MSNQENFEEYEEDAPRGNTLLYFLLAFLVCVTAFVVWVNVAKPKAVLDFRDRLLQNFDIQNPFAVQDESILDPNEISAELKAQDAAVCQKLEEMGVIVIRDTITKLGSVVHLNAETNSDEAMALVGKLTWLNAINASGANVTDEQTAHWVNLKYLTSLNVQNNSLTSASLKNIAQMPSIDGLYLEGTEISGEDLEQLLNLKTVKIMNIGKSKLTDEDMKIIGQMKSLHWILVEEVGLTDACLPYFMDMPNLKTLTIREGNQITPEGAEKFVKDFYEKNGIKVDIN